MGSLSDGALGGRGRVSADLAEVRHHMAVLARQRRKCILGWPRDWRPTEVVNPATGEPFTPWGAWQFVAELLERGYPLEEVILKRPPGKRAYVMRVDLQPRSPQLYIKVQLGSGQLIGRSFHLSRTEESSSESESE